MKLSRLLLTTTTALGLSMTAAVADDNDAFLDQDGVGNAALIDQSTATNSTVGRSDQDDSVAQSGNANNLDVKQDGDGHVIGSGGRFEQRGNNNRANIQQFGTNNEFVFMDQFAPGANSVANSNKLRVRQGGSDNRVKEVRQTQNGGTSGDANDIDIWQQSGTNLQIGGRVTQKGTGNEMDIDQTGSDNTISPVNANVVLQDGNDNNMVLSQSGSGNLLKQAQQVGDNNQTNVSMAGAGNGIGGLTVGGASGASMAIASQVDQYGDQNQVDLMITGDNNAFGTLQDGNFNLALGIDIMGDDNSVGVGQFGDTNQIDLAAVTGNGNSIGFYQRGDLNFGSTQVDRDNNDALISQDGNRNEAYLEVFGQRNEASLSVVGDDNYLNGYQRGRSHSMTVDLTGDGNNSASAPSAFTGAALAASDYVTTSGKLKSTPFGPGDLVQLDQSAFNQQRNTLLITGVNADDNSFAMYQNGSRNSITGTISNGSSNQAVVAQIGSFNATSFTQSGSLNNLGVIQ